MPKQRKTDKYRQLENRGVGRKEEYQPFYKVHEFGSRGRVHRIMGWITRRVYQLMSDLELYYFLIRQWDGDNIIDIREQFPLLPLEETLQIAEEEGIIHPPRSRKNKTVMTTDFVITFKEGGLLKDIAIAIKYNSDADNSRTKEKLRLEELFWKKKGIDWKLVTDKEIPKRKGQNIYYIYNSYFWAEEKGLGVEKIQRLTYQFLNKLTHNNLNILQSINEFEIENCWVTGEGLSFFNLLLTRKIISTDLNKKFNYHTMDIVINDEEVWKIDV
ncbi:TnsA endonuclease N-terminal domain-containing protein [Brassicibacter mesophilus]|uniref:TnsA endonuclease N-terminal domain-containing protein n=1 Tax=Brassicibacter mesophilus TaxID=745119 RepID=UPI003D19078C